MKPKLVSSFAKSTTPVLSKPLELHVREGADFGKAETALREFLV
ncbi:hypothetical protein FACS189490_14240 [Clostridia bacterium]|nr:hypothetical protein FACS189490_14240 [Clostridia bacterium]